MHSLVVAEATVVIAAGGTGGHIYPGLALADALKRIDGSTLVSFIGTRRGLEGSIVPGAGYRLHTVDMVPFSGPDRFLFPWRLSRSTIQARRILRREGASVAVSMGGYAGAPAVAAARLSGIPSLMHESGAISGRANRLTSRLTPNVALAYETSGKGLTRGTRTRVVGMPLGRWASEFDREALRPEARRHFDLPSDLFTVLILGGSQGAARLNSAAISLAERWEGRDDLAIVLKTGKDHVAGVERALSGTKAVVRCVSYVERMELAYAAADLAVSRAGAATVAELAVTSTPSILVPYPHATHDHQTANASLLVAAGAAVMVPDDLATADTLAPLVEEVAHDRDKLSRMSSSAKGIARPHAAEDLAEWVLELAAVR